MFRGASAFVFSAMLVALVVAGCGSSDDGGDSQTFVKEANLICTKGNEVAGAKIVKAYERPDIKESNSEKDAISLEVSVLVPYLIEDAETQLEGIKGMDAPGGDEEEIEAITTAYEDWIEKAKATPFKIVVANDIYNDARDLNRKYGLKKCAETGFEAPYSEG